LATPLKQISQAVHHNAPFGSVQSEIHKVTHAKLHNFLKFVVVNAHCRKSNTKVVSVRVQAV